MTQTNTAPPLELNARLGALEGLRGLMALWVVIGHVSLTFGWRIPLVDLNPLAVDVFVLLSGYVIARLLDRKAEPYPTYLLRRAMRIMPLYLIVLLGSVALLPLQHDVWTRALSWGAVNASRLRVTQAAQAHPWPHLLAHLTMLHGMLPQSWLPDAPYTLLGQAWSISLEWQFYLCAPLLISGWHRPYAKLFAITLFATLLATGTGLTNAYLGNRITYFLLGTLSYWLMEQRGPTASRGWLGAAFVVMAGLSYRHGGTLTLIPLAIWGSVMASIKAPEGSSSRALATALAHPWLVRLGERSYALYLVHMMPLYVAIWGLSRLGVARPALDIMVLAITFLASGLLCTAAWHWIEAPCIALGGKWGRHLTRWLGSHTNAGHASRLPKPCGARETEQPVR